MNEIQKLQVPRRKRFNETMGMNAVAEIVLRYVKKAYVRKTAISKELGGGNSL